MKILKLTGVKPIRKIAQKEINGGGRPNCIDRACMRACIQTGQTPYECYIECMIC
ncbi:hypothetical protein [Aquimarina sp. AU58]|uniref:hypothetical protein n=1 Tax=Aquimarina sp. AU58 TaxID=1874112 RepID=UPI0013581500|nr:hypothetical protein [Aquimarina sp. AU58]